MDLILLAISVGGIVGIVIAVIVILIIVWMVSLYNSLKKIEVKCDESLSGIDVALEKRFDELTKLLDVTKGYAKHEAETLENVIKWRAGAKVSDSTIEEKNALLGQLDQVAKGLNVVVEKYPELKADTLFKNLQASISDTEEHLQAARRLYNSNVTIINQKIVVFPNSIVAGMFHIVKREFFKAEEAKRQDPKMDFS